MTGIEEIRERIRQGKAVILTASEFKKRVEVGESFDDVDVVTCGTCGVMSGTYAVLSVPVAKPGTFLRAESITLNGVPAVPGPCPNERLGLVDLIVYGTAHASGQYGGGHLFQDIIADREIHVEVTSEGTSYSTNITGKSLPHARLFTTRSAFKNYTAIINQSSVPVQTIFSVLLLAGNRAEVTVSGCGEINPIENDPKLRFLKAGSTVLVNGGLGKVIGEGTRSSPARPNIAVHGDMAGMDPGLCGGFKTSAGPECLTSIGTAIPLVDDAVVAALMVRDTGIVMPVMDISDRQQVSNSTYDRVWTGTSRSVRYDPAGCLRCDPCRVGNNCPVDAIDSSGKIDHARCFRCGTCVHLCKGSTYLGIFGSLNLPDGTVPVVLRQSDRVRAEIICKQVKIMIQEGSFQI